MEVGACGLTRGVSEQPIYQRSALRRVPTIDFKGVSLSLCLVWLHSLPSQVIDGTSPLIQAVLADPHVQSCLVDSRIRRALETLVVNPQNAAALMSDPIVRDVIIFLSQLIARVS